MNLDSINKWLTLLANIGVLVGIAVVAFELRQTQTAMQAESSTMRTQMAIQHQNISRTHNMAGLREKVQRGEQLTPEELLGVDEWFDFMLRYFENLHFQYQLGVLDEEIWQANRSAIDTMCSDPLFPLVRDWPNHPSIQRYRQSFVQMVIAPCQ